MEMLTDQQIIDADLADWRKLGQGLHARFRVNSFSAAAGFVTAIGAAGDEVGHHPRVTVGDDFVDLKLISHDAVYQDAAGIKHIVEWTTQRDIDLARRISELAAEHNAEAEPNAITTIEIALDTAQAATIAPVWAALLTGDPHAKGHGTIGDDIRDATGRVPILWFQDTTAHHEPRQRFHIDVWVPYEVAEHRIAAALAAGGVIADDSHAPGYTVIADQEGNKGCVCTSPPPPPVSLINIGASALA